MNPTTHETTIEADPVVADRDGMLVSGMDVGVTEGHRKRDALLV